MSGAAKVRTGASPRRGRLKIAAGAGSAVVIALTALVVWAIWWSGGSDDSRFDLGLTEAFEIGSVTTVEEGKFHLVRLSQDEFIALSWVDPHRGCMVRWRPNFIWPISGDGEQKKGWFREGCDGDTYDISGHLVFGPSPRDLDRFVVSTEGGRVVVDTNTYVCGHSLPGESCATPQP